MDCIQMAIDSAADTTARESSLNVNLGTRSYSVRFGAGNLDGVGHQISNCVAGKRLLLATDENVAGLYLDRVVSNLDKAGFRITAITLPAGEQTKSLKFVGSLYDAAIDAELDRQSAIVALGGGVIGDLAGFAAATYARGIAFVQLPTTLLAMVDSAVGGKVGIDHPKAKNIIGAFHQPKLVVADVECLRTLPAREFRSGMAEVVKYGVILDADFFAWLERNVELVDLRNPAALMQVVRRSCELKAKVVEIDEFETSGQRAALNYGHTFAHAIETVTGYSEYTHGEAVAIGMMQAARLAVDIGLVDAALWERQRDLWTAFKLPTQLTKPLPPKDLLAAMRRDKKAVAGRLRLVLPTRIGQVRVVDDVAEDRIEAVLSSNVEPKLP